MTHSKPESLGRIAPEFSLPNTITGQHFSLDDLSYTKGFMVMFICNHCPFVVHLAESLGVIAQEYSQRGIGFVAISSNDVSTHPQDSPKNMTAFAKNYNFPFAYLYDESQQIAREYGAVCTPDFFIFNEKKECVYRGQWDSSRPGSATPITGSDACAVFEALIENRAIPQEQIPSVGCSIKWK